MAERVSIIVLCRDRWADTRRCLAAVRRHTAPGSYELLVYDNASKDATPRNLRSMARSWPELRAVKNERNVPYAEAVNRGMRAAKGRYLLWLNNDTVPGPGWLDALLAALRSDEKLAAVGPLTDHMAPPGQVVKRFRPPAGPELRDAAFLGGFCFLMRREALERAGFLDERFVWGWEDMDYCLRLRQAGWRLALARHLFVKHPGSRTINRMPKPQRRRTDLANRRLMLEKWLYLEPFREDIRELFKRTGAPWDNYRPRVSVIVPVRGPACRTIRCLEAVRRCAGSEKYEVLAVPLPGAEAPLASLMPDWPELRVLDLPAPPTVPTMFNRALRAAEGEYFILLDEGAVVAPGWIQGLVAAAKRTKDAGASGPLIRGAFYKWQRASRKVPPGDTTPMRFLHGGCLLLARHAVDSVGGIDERFQDFGWDVDYCLRLRQGGFRLLVAHDAILRAPSGPPRFSAPRDILVLGRKWIRSRPFGGELRRLFDDANPKRRRRRAARELFAGLAEPASGARTGCSGA